MIFALPNAVEQFFEADEFKVYAFKFVFVFDMKLSSNCLFFVQPSVVARDNAASPRLVAPCILQQLWKQIGL